MREAQARGLELIKPGESCADVDLAIQKYFTQAGYGDFMMHRVGHGMGLLPHERPYIHWKMNPYLLYYYNKNNFL